MVGPFQQMEVEEMRGGLPVFRWKIDKGLMLFAIDHENEWLDVHMVSTEEPGVMKSMIDALVNQLPFNAVRFIAPLDDSDKEYTEELGRELDERFDTVESTTPKNDRNIRDVLNNYEETRAEYRDGNEYTMLVTIWNTE